MLTPDEIASRQFLVSLRGYDRDEVDRFLEQVAGTVAELERQIRELEDQAEATPSRVPAQREVPSDVVAAQPVPAQVSPQEAFKALGEETTRILVAAEESARSIKHKAEERAQQELETARREARDEVESARRTASKVVADAERRRNQIAEDARALEAVRDKFAEQLREAVRTTTSSMRGLAPSSPEPTDDGGRELAAGRTVPHDREGRPARSAVTIEDDDDASRATTSAVSAGGPVGVEDVLDVDEAEPVEDLWDRTADDDAPAQDATTPTYVFDDLGGHRASVGSIGSSASAESSESATSEASIGSEASIESAGSAASEESVEEPDDDAGDASDVWDVSDVEVEVEVDVDDPAAGEETTELSVADAADHQDHGAAEAERPDDVVPVVVADGDAAGDDGEPAPSAAVDPRQQREQSLAAIRPGLLRMVKRSLQDVQNDVLDALRRAGDAPDLEPLLPDDEELAGLGAVGEEFLSDAYAAGLRDGALLADRELPDGAGDEARVPARAATFGAVIAHEVTAALRATLRAGIEAGEVGTSLSERVGEIFRDLKGPVAEVTVDEHLSRTYGYGTLDAWTALDIPAKEWVPGVAPRCPEEMRGQNADAGAVALADEFPTGQVVPPAHDGCDCTLVPR